MASGVAIHDDVVHVYNEMKVRKTGTSEQERPKLVLYRLSNDGRFIIVDEGSMLRVKHVEGEEDIFKKVMSSLPKNECRYALYDCSYQTKDSTKEDLVFIMWVPEDATLKSKMIYAASKSALKEKLKGIKFEWQVNEICETKDNSCLVDKLGGRGVVTSLEGKPL